MEKTQLFEVGETARTGFIVAYAGEGDNFAFRDGKVVEVIPTGNFFDYMVDFGKQLRYGSGDIVGPVVRMPQNHLIRKFPTKEIPNETFLKEVEGYKNALTQDMTNEQRHLILHGLEILLNRAIATKK